MSGPLTRRRALQIGASTTIALSAGCLGFSSVTADGSEESADSAWPMFQRDPGNTGANTGISAVPDDGTVLWHIRNRTSTPVVADETVYVADFTDERALVARELSTGRELWRSPIPRGQVGTAPAVTDDRVVQQSFGMIHAFDRERGEELWTYDPGSGAPGAPAVVEDTVYVTQDAYQDDPAKAIAISVADGTERWKVALRGEHASTLSHGAETVFVGSSEGFVVGLDVRDGSERWRFETEAGVRTAVSTDEDTVYATDDASNLYALNVEDGEKYWQLTVGEGGRPSTPAIGDGTVYVGTEGGMVAIDAADSTQEWTFPTDERAGPPVTDDQTVYFGGTGWDDRAIHALDTDSGQEKWSRETERREEGDEITAGVFGPPVPVAGHLLVTAADGLSAFEPDSNVTE